jgi:hypothetical protein
MNIQKLSDIPSRNSKTNSFQKRRANFSSSVNLNKEQHNNNNNSIQFFIYLRADSTAIGLLQSQHGHIQQQQHNNNNNNSMQLSPFWEVTGRSATQEFSNIL